MCVPRDGERAAMLVEGESGRGVLRECLGGRAVNAGVCLSQARCVDRGWRITFRGACSFICARYTDSTSLW